MSIQDWANAVLAMPLVFVALDTTGIRADSDIIRVCVADREGQTTYDTIIRSIRQPDQPNSHFTGITQEAMSAANSLAHNWPYLQEALVGRYVLAYNKFVQERMSENAAHYGLPPIRWIGECLQIKAETHYGLFMPKLVDICQRVGYTLPSPALAEQRIAGQVAILNVWANGQTPIDEDTEDDHPF